MSTNDELCALCHINHHEPGAKPCPAWTHLVSIIPRPPRIPKDIAETAVETVRPASR